MLTHISISDTVWGAYSPYKMSGKVDGKTYKTRSAALDACMQNKKCVGFTQNSNTNYYLNSKTTKTKTAGKIAHVKLGKGKFSNSYMWQEKSGYALSGSASSTTYKTFDTAAKACSTSTACKGITYESAKKFKLNSSKTAEKSTGKIAWIKRGKTTAYKSYYWTENTGFKGENYISTTSYSTLATAKQKCLANSKCGGVTKSGSKYYLNKYHSLSSSTGTTVYAKGGEQIKQVTVTMTNSGYTWKMKSPWQYKTKLGKTKYTSLTKALKACAKNSKCKGVTKEKAKTYYLGSGTAYKPGKNMAIFIKYGSVSTYGGYTWTAKSDYTMSGGLLSSTAYTTKAKALAACKANSKCTGVVYKKKKYYLGKGSSFKKSSGLKVYKKTSKFTNHLQTNQIDYLID